ncbi:MAG: response regulator [Promethearchaeota archaeon]
MVILVILFFIPENITAEPGTSLEIKVGFYENPPKIYKIENNNYTNNLQYTGFFPELLNYIAEQEGWSLTYVEGTWTQCLDRLSSGEIDVLPDVGFSNERAELYNFTQEPVITDLAYIYTLDNSSIQTFEELENKRIAVMKNDIDYIGPRGFLNISKIFNLNCEIVEYDDLISVFESIANRTVDAGVANGLFGNHNAYKYNLQRTLLSFNKIDFKFAFPKNKSLTNVIAPIIDEWVKNLKNDENSIYYDLYDEFIAPIQDSSTNIPSWVFYSFLGLAATALLFLTISIIFKNRVKKKTLELQIANNMITGISDNLVNGYIYQLTITKGDIPPKYNYIGAGIENVLGVKPEEAYKDPYIQYKLMHPDDLPTFKKKEHEAYQEFLKNKQKKNKKVVFFAETRFILPDGSIRWLQITSSPHFGKNNNIIWNGVALDITERKKIEEEEKKLLKQLQQSQKLDALGQLAGGIAHDFNNVLTSIIGMVELIKIEDNKEKKEEYLNTILSVAKKTGKLTKNLLTFARKEIYLKKTVNMISLISETVRLLRSTLDKSIAISLDNTAEHVHVLGDESNLQNLIMNLGINASQAMPNGGNLDFSIENVILDEEFCNSSQFNIFPGEFVKISIKDNGCGMPPDILDKIFDPFFTTKSKGTGLGLTVCLGIIKTHKGAIKVKSKLNIGSVFEVYLPVSLKPLIKPNNTHENNTHENNTHENNTHENNTHEIAQIENISSRHGTLLVVEDEKPIRLLITTQLERIGYKVISAEDGVMGLKNFQEFRDKIDLIILDVIMPKMGGKEFLKEIRQKDTEIPVLISSGYAKKEEISELQALGISDILHKPFEIRDLINLVNKWIGH